MSEKIVPHILTPKESAVRHRQKKTEQKRIQRARQEQAALSRQDKIRQVLKESWGVQHPHVLDVLVELGNAAAETLHRQTSPEFWEKSPTGLGREANSPQDDEVKGELIHRSDLYALWNFSSAWETDSMAPTFEDFLKLRRRCKTDPLFLGNEILGMDLHDKPHKRWADLLCRFNPDLLKADYSQEDMKRALAETTGETRLRMLLASRNSYKSSFALRVFLLQGQLFCYDIRALIVSETRALSEKMAAGFKRTMSISNYHNRSRLQKLFPEIMTKAGQGESLVWNNPMAHLDLLAPQMESSSMDSLGMAGNRADLILYDDCISNMSVGTSAMREKSVVKFDALNELLEVGGQIAVLGTPWHEEDLYSVLLDRNEKSHTMEYIIDPAWTVRPDALHKKIWDLKEEDVDLLFPARLTWKVLQEKLRQGDAAARTFRMQSLCQFLPEVESENKLQFDRATILRHVIPPSAISGEYKATMDNAFSKTKYADLSCISIVKTDGSNLIVQEQSAGQWRTQEKAEEILRLHAKYSLKSLVIEAFAGQDDLLKAVKEEARRRGVTPPQIYSVPADSKVKYAKWHRLKTSLEAPLHSGKIKLVEGGWIEELISELEFLHEKEPTYRSGGGNKHDDRADSLALAVKFFMPCEEEDKTSAVEEMEKAQEEGRRRQETYDMIFGGQSKWRQGMPQFSEKDNSPGYEVRRGTFGIPGINPKIYSPPRPQEKPKTFSDLLKKN